MLTVEQTKGDIHMTKWNADLYDQKHQFVSNFGESLVSVLQPKNGE